MKCPLNSLKVAFRWINVNDSSISTSHITKDIVLTLSPIPCCHIEMVGLKSTCIFPVSCTFMPMHSTTTIEAGPIQGEIWNCRQQKDEMGKKLKKSKTLVKF